MWISVPACHGDAVDEALGLDEPGGDAVDAYALGTDLVGASVGSREGGVVEK
jgi:hypothetical protein